MDRENLRHGILACTEAYKGTTGDPKAEVLLRDNARAIFYKKFDDPDGYNEIEISIAGTNDLYDIVEGAKRCYRKPKKHGIKVHRGFYRHALKLRRALANRIENNDIVTIYGHSLGGISAQILSLDLAEKCLCVTVITYGAPKGFKRSFKLPENVTWIEVATQHDLIPRYPLCNRFNRWKMEDLNYKQYFQFKLMRQEDSWWKHVWRLLRILWSSKGYMELVYSLHQYHSLKHYLSFFDEDVTKEEILGEDNG